MFARVARNTTRTFQHRWFGSSAKSSSSNKRRPALLGTALVGATALLGTVHAAENRDGGAIYSLFAKVPPERWSVQSMKADEADTEISSNVESMFRLASVRHLVLASQPPLSLASEYGSRLMRHCGSFTTVQAVDVSCDTAVDLLACLPRSDAAVLISPGDRPTMQQFRHLLSQTSLQHQTLPLFSLQTDLLTQVASLPSQPESDTACTTTPSLFSQPTAAGMQTALQAAISFVNQVGALASLTHRVSQVRNNQPAPQSLRSTSLLDSLQRMHGLTKGTVEGPSSSADRDHGTTHSAGQSDSHNHVLDRIAGVMAGSKSVFVLGKGFAHPVAEYSAFILKEFGQVHAEGYSGGALKHGPFALIEKGTPIVMIVLDDDNLRCMRTAAEEVRARGAYTIVITDRPEQVKSIASEVIQIPSNGPLSALLALFPIAELADRTARVSSQLRKKNRQRKSLAFALDLQDH